MTSTIACQPHEAEKYARWLKRGGIIVSLSFGEPTGLSLAAYPFKPGLPGRKVTSPSEIMVEEREVLRIIDVSGHEIGKVEAVATDSCEEIRANLGTICHYSVDIETAELTIFCRLKYTPLDEYLKTKK